MHLFLQHFVFITLSIPAAEKAFSFLTEVRGEDCLSFYRGEKMLHLRPKKVHNCSRTTHISYDRDNASTLILFYGQFLQKILCNLFICLNHANTEICSDFSTIHSHSRDIAGFFPNLTPKTGPNLNVLSLNMSYEQKGVPTETLRHALWLFITLLHKEKQPAQG